VITIDGRRPIDEIVAERAEQLQRYVNLIAARVWSDT
jgi:hypothetical protein